MCNDVLHELHPSLCPAPHDDDELELELLLLELLLELLPEELLLLELLPPEQVPSVIDPVPIAAAVNGLAQ